MKLKEFGFTFVEFTSSIAVAGLVAFSAIPEFLNSPQQNSQKRILDLARELQASSPLREAAMEREQTRSLWLQKRGGAVVASSLDTERRSAELSPEQFLPQRLSEDFNFQIIIDKNCQSEKLAVCPAASYQVSDCSSGTSLSVIVSASGEEHLLWGQGC